MTSNNSVSVSEFDFLIPVLGLILSQNAPIKLTEQFSWYHSSLWLLSILMYYTHLLTGHLPDVIIHHAAEAHTHTHTHTHTNLLVSEETLSSTPSKAHHYCVREWVGKWSVMLEVKGVKDTSYSQMRTTPPKRALIHTPDHVFSPLLCPPPSPALVGFIHQ